jgi:zinc protease
MNERLSTNFLRKTLIVVGLLTALQSGASAQVSTPPERTRLLNDLQVLLSPGSGGQDVLIKLRIHSGAAFDLAGKAGTMALLGDLLFPDPNTREYFTEEMQGRLGVVTDYDSITITMQGRTREFERIVEILRTALVTTQLTPENITKAREGRIKIVRETSGLPSAVADRAIAARFFGDFPYGRPYSGTVESLERVQRADVMLARERFLNPNNATLVIVGNVQPSRAKRALRQLLGGWRKSESIVPATFKQPSIPDERTLMINAPADQSVDVRLAVRGFARRDPDAAAATLLANVARQRWEKLLPELSRSPVFVRQDAFALPGMFVMGTTVDNLLAGKTLATAKEVMKSLVTTPVSAAELEQAKSEVVSLTTKALASSDGLVEAWLDIDTYKLPSIADQASALSAITADDLRRAAGRLVERPAFATVVVGNSELVKTQIEQLGKVEVMGEMDPKPDTRPETKSGPNGAKPQTKSASKPS